MIRLLHVIISMEFEIHVFLYLISEGYLLKYLGLHYGLDLWGFSLIEATELLDLSFKFTDILHLATFGWNKLWRITMVFLGFRFDYFIFDFFDKWIDLPVCVR